MTGKGAKNPLVVSLLNDRVFSPAPAKDGGEEEKDLKQIKTDRFELNKAKKQRVKQKQLCENILTDSLS